MQVSLVSNSNTALTSNNLQDIMQNLNYEDKRVLREALSSVDSKDLPKVIRAISKIPPDTNYLKNLLNTIDEFKPQSGFSIYA